LIKKVGKCYQRRVEDEKWFEDIIMYVLEELAYWREESTEWCVEDGEELEVYEDVRNLLFYACTKCVSLGIGYRRPCVEIWQR